MSSPGSSAKFTIGDQTFVVIGRSNQCAIPKLLSKGEGEVYALLAAGLDKIEIAERRETSVGTVANQLRSIYKKLGLRGRPELLARVVWKTPTRDLEGATEAE